MLSVTTDPLQDISSSRISQRRKPLATFGFRRVRAGDIKERRQEQNARRKWLIGKVSAESVQIWITAVQ